MKTNLNITIGSSEDAELFLKDLFSNREHFNPEDDAFDVDFKAINHQVTDDERIQLNSLMIQAFSIPDFDPFEFLLNLETENSVSW